MCGSRERRGPIISYTNLKFIHASSLRLQSALLPVGTNKLTQMTPVNGQPLGVIGGHGILTGREER